LRRRRQRRRRSRGWRSARVRRKLANAARLVAQIGVLDLGRGARKDSDQNDVRARRNRVHRIEEIDAGVLGDARAWRRRRAGQWALHRVAVGEEERPRRGVGLVRVVPCVRVSKLPVDFKVRVPVKRNHFDGHVGGRVPHDRLRRHDGGEGVRCVERHSAVVVLVDPQHVAGRRVVRAAHAQCRAALSLHRSDEHRGGHRRRARARAGGWRGRRR